MPPSSGPRRVFERHDASYGAFYEAERVLEERTSEWQDITIIDTQLHGRVMLLDGLTMLTDHTHYVYHELMVHVPLACHPAPERALVIGGGDGGVATELAKHDGLKEIIIAELDGAVVEVSKRWFPEIAKGFDDPRVRLEIGDGAAFAAAHKDAFDIVIIDSTDVCDETGGDTEVASPLATDAFYASLKRAMRPGAIGMQVLGSPHFYAPSLGRLLRRLNEDVWPNFKPMMMPCPFYITGDWCAGLFSLDGELTPWRFPLPSSQLAYLNAQTAVGALAAPNNVLRMMGALPDEHQSEGGLL